MTMTYDTLTGAKGAAGAVATWVNYSKLDTPTIVDEAQTLIYQTLRVREMRVSTQFTLTLGQSTFTLPNSGTGQFLEPLLLRDITNGITLIPNDERFVSYEKLNDIRQFSGGVLTNGTPGHVAIYDENFVFDVGASGTTTYQLVYYLRPNLLATGSPQNANFLTARYPHILRTACMAQAADFMKDTEEYNKLVARLGQLIDAVNKGPDVTQAGALINNDPSRESSVLSMVPTATAPVDAVFLEAQALVYSRLRVREMRVSASLTLNNGNNSVALPGASTGQFLEPVTLHDDTNGVSLIPNDVNYVSEKRLLTLRSNTAGVPTYVAIFNEAFQFDVPAQFVTSYTVVFYQRPANLANRDASNFLTLRYPQILRTANQAAVADYQGNSDEHQKCLARLDALCQVANAESAAQDTKLISSEINKPGVEATLLNFISDTQVPVQAILLEAQALAYSRLRVREMRVSTPLTLASSTNTIALPGAATGQFLEPIALYDSTGTITFIPNDQRYVSQQRLLQLQGASLQTGTPQFVSIFNEALNFDVNASGTTSFTLVFYQRPANLTNQNSSNFLTLRYPHILRAAAQVALADFKHDTAGRTAALQVLDALCKEANDEAALLDGGMSGLNTAAVEGSQLSFIPTTSTAVQQVLIEAQQLLYGILRTREMMTELSFFMPANSAYIALPARFLDPIGPIQTTSFNSRIRHKDSNYIQSNRNYTETIGTLGNNPFTTASASFSVTVNLPNHGFTQDSVFECSGATTFNGVTINGTFPVSGIVDANNFTIDVTSLGVAPSGSSAGGGSAVTYLADVLTSGTPYFFGIWNERINFEQAFFQQTICKLQYYQSLPLLTSQDQTNFLTNRYPQLLRLAMQAAEANMKRDRAGYDAIAAELAVLVQVVNAENDMQHRGLELDPWIP